jgi:alpha-glucosidase
MKYYFLDPFDLSIGSSDILIAKGPQVLICSLPNIPFLRVCVGKDDFSKGYGTFEITDHDLCMTTGWEIQTVDASLTSICLRGILTSRSAVVPFTIEFKKMSAKQLGFKIEIKSEAEAYKTVLTYESDPEDAIFGTGEQFTHLNLKGHSVPIMVREDGVGRGLQPLTFFTNRLFGPFAGGDDVSMYKVCMIFDKRL